VCAIQAISKSPIRLQTRNDVFSIGGHGEKIHRQFCLHVNDRSVAPHTDVATTTQWHLHVCTPPRRIRTPQDQELRSGATRINDGSVLPNPYHRHCQPTHRPTTITIASSRQRRNHVFCSGWRFIFADPQIRCDGVTEQIHRVHKNLFVFLLSHENMLKNFLLKFGR